MKLPINCPHCTVCLETDDFLAHFSTIYKDPKDAMEMALVHDAIVPNGEKLNRLVAVYDWDKDRTSHFVCPDCKGKIESDE